MPDTQTVAARKPWLDPAQKPFVRIQKVTKKFGDFTAVWDVSLDIFKGELFCLLGGSGSGKSTLLRMIAGFEAPTSGRIEIDGQDMTHVAPYDRPTNMMFQSYALFPHMTVAENLDFGLVARKVPPDERRRRREAVLGMVRLQGFEGRYPRELSGGQQQRVALGRALVGEPDVLLLDEPLSNLDAALRQEMKIEIRQLQQSLGLTTIFVTHDQDEAMSTADRMVLMRQGRVEQIGTPDAVFNMPASRFTAEFMGIPNLIPGRMTGTDRFEAKAGGVFTVAGQPRLAGPCVLALRPELIAISATPLGEDANSLPAEVEIMTYHGAAVEYRLQAGAGLVMTARAVSPALGGPAVLSPGTPVHLHWPAGSGVLVPEM